MLVIYNVPKVKQKIKNFFIMADVALLLGRPTRIFDSFKNLTIREINSFTGEVVSGYGPRLNAPRRSVLLHSETPGGELKEQIRYSAGFNAKEKVLDVRADSPQEEKKTTKVPRIQPLAF